MNRFTPILSALLLAAALDAQSQEWIWHNNKGAAHGNNERRFFRKEFTVEGKVQKATLVFTVDNEGTAFINSRSAATAIDWESAATADVTADIKPGANVLGIRGINHGGAAGVVARLELTHADGKKTTVVTDTSWVSHAEELTGWQKLDFKTEGWTKAVSIAKLGAAPWGNVLAAAPKSAGARREATVAESLFTQPNFKVELVHTSEPGEEGSWVAMTKDSKGRLIISPQYGKNNPEGGLLRITIGADGKVAKREQFAKSFYDCQGLLHANGSLYAVVNKYSTKWESGLYRLKEQADDTYSAPELLKIFPGNGEHGPHAVILGPDKKSLYILAGNHTKLPEGISHSPLKNWGEDHVLPRQWDGNGHATGILAPGGYVTRTDFDGKNWDLFCAGFRNPYDIAFNPEGELFTFDADMEWDWGMPWYRPTRVNHCVSGGEYGWRSGTGKWPDFYADSLGAIDIGLGCPTGIEFGTGAKFPSKYERALYVLDWTFGRIIAVHMSPDGSTYSGTYENFVAPMGLVKPGEPKRPLNVTDLLIGNDGAMYFTVGGRNTQAALYRVVYKGVVFIEDRIADPKIETARKVRRDLEAFHGKVDPKAVDFLWPHLNSNDRAIRFAARVALEWQPVDQWKARAVAEKNPNAGITALLALARTDKSAQADVFGALAKFPLASLTEEQALAKLRVIQLSIIRQGKPTGELAKTAIEKLSPHFPNKNEVINKEISQILIAIGAPDIVGKTLKHMATLDLQEDLMHYIFHLRTAKNWTPEQRREYLGYWPKSRLGLNHPAKILNWFEEAGRPYGDGSSFGNFMKNFRKEAVDNLSDAEKVEFAELINAPISNISAGRATIVFPQPRTLSPVREWKSADLAGSLADVASGRNFESGRQAFVDAQCLACHRFGNEGGGTGPDLTAISARFSSKDNLEAILNPSKVVSEQFINTIFILKNDDEVTGRLLSENTDTVEVLVNPLTNQKQQIKKSEIRTRKPSKLSPMPEGLVNGLKKEEILDLLAFLESSGRKNHPAFKK